MQHLPAETHDLVVAVTRERARETTGNRTQKNAIFDASQPKLGAARKVPSRPGMPANGEQPAAEEEHHGQRA